MVKTFHGSCLCGAVKFECDLDLAAGSMRCSCAFCMKARFWVAFAKGDAFRLLQGQDALADYQRTTPTQPTPFLHFYFCKTCGVRTFTYGPASERLGEAFHAVNLASLDDVTDEELAATPIHFADGRHNDWDHATGFRFL